MTTAAAMRFFSSAATLVVKVPPHACSHQNEGACALLMGERKRGYEVLGKFRYLKIPL
jgi:hypothetical protein